MLPAADFECHSTAVKFISQTGKDIVEHKGRSLHATLDGNAHQGTLEAVTKATYIPLTSVQLYAVVIAERHKIAVYVGVAVKAAVGVEISVRFYRVVEPVDIASANEIVVAQDGAVVRFVKDYGFVSGGV